MSRQNKPAQVLGEDPFQGTLRNDGRLEQSLKDPLTDCSGGEKPLLDSVIYPSSADGYGEIWRGVSNSSTYRLFRIRGVGFMPDLLQMQKYITLPGEKDEWVAEWQR